MPSAWRSWAVRVRTVVAPRVKRMVTLPWQKSFTPAGASRRPRTWYWNGDFPSTRLADPPVNCDGATGVETAGAGWAGGVAAGGAAGTGGPISGVPKLTSEPLTGLFGQLVVMLT